MSSWLKQISRHREMYEAVRAEALRSFPPSDAHPPNSQPQQCTHHLWNENDDAGVNVADRDTEELEELEVGGSLILDEDEAMRDGGDERDAYTRDLEALVEFLISEDADGGQEDELFERLMAKVISLRILIHGGPNDSVTEHLHDCRELARLSRAARRCCYRRS
jgi:hypothetical protein